MNALFRGSSAPVTQFSSQRPKVRSAVCQKLLILAVTPINRKARIHHKPTVLQLKYLLSKSRHWDVQTMYTESASCPDMFLEWKRGDEGVGSGAASAKSRKGKDASCSGKRKTSLTATLQNLSTFSYFFVISGQFSTLAMFFF